MKLAWTLFAGWVVLGVLGFGGAPMPAECRAVPLGADLPQTCRDVGFTLAYQPALGWWVLVGLLLPLTVYLWHRPIRVN
jgi:hypothetical protein